MGINLNLFLIKYELDQMSNYLGLLGQAIGEKLENIDEEYHHLPMDEMSDDEWSILDDQYTDKFMEIGRGFPQLLLTSFIIAWYSFVEQHLIKLCDDLKLTITLNPREQEISKKASVEPKNFWLTHAANILFIIFIGKN